MTQRLDNATSLIINDLTKNLNVNSLLADKSEISIMRSLEIAYWKYIDEYCVCANCPFIKFLNIVFHMKGIKDYISRIPRFIKEFEKLKRSTPTSGCIVISGGIYDPYILLVRVFNSQVFSFPKGKREDNETSMETAIRETYEETGFRVCREDISGNITIYGTDMFLVFVNTIHTNVHHRDINEIPCVRWTKASDIIKYSCMYSKLTYSSIRLLVNNKFIKQKAKNIANDI